MKPSQLTHAAEENTRVFEKKMTDAEHKLSREKNSKVESIARIAYLMADFSKIHLRESPHLSSEIQALLKNRESIRTKFEQALAQTESVISSSLIELSSLKDKKKSLLKNMDDVLKNSTEYQEISKNLEDKEVSHAGALIIDSQMRAEFEGKLSVYDADPIYQYLKSREKTGNYFTKYFDGLLSKWVNYSVNFENELLMISALNKLSENISYREKEIKDLKKQKYEVSNDLIASLNIDQIDSAIRAKEDFIDVEKMKASSCRNNIRLITEEKDGGYEEIIHKIKKGFSLKTISELMEIAKQTDTDMDEAIVRKLEDEREFLRKTEINLIDLEKKFKEAVSNYEKARSMESTFSKFKSKKYYFDDSLDVTSLMAGYMLGNLSTREVESKVENHRHRNHDEDDYSTSSRSSSSASGSSNWGSSSSSSSDWTSSFSTSDSTNSGSYSTSDSF